MLVFLLLLPCREIDGAILHVVDGDLIGASNVDVGGSLFNVTFVDGTCIGLFGGCDQDTDFDFATLAQAQLASQALLDQVLIDGPLGRFDAIPATVRGCDPPLGCGALTPFRLSGSSNVLVASAVNLNTAIQGTGDYVDGGSLPITRDTGDFRDAVYARWSPVPEPSTAALIALGLGLMSSARRSMR